MCCARKILPCKHLQKTTPARVRLDMHVSKRARTCSPSCSITPLCPTVQMNLCGFSLTIVRTQFCRHMYVRARVRQCEQFGLHKRMHVYRLLIHAGVYAHAPVLASSDFGGLARVTADTQICTCARTCVSHDACLHVHPHICMCQHIYGTQTHILAYTCMSTLATRVRQSLRDHTKSTHMCCPHTHTHTHTRVGGHLHCHTHRSRRDV